MKSLQLIPVIGKLIIENPNEFGAHPINEHVAAIVFYGMDTIKMDWKFSEDEFEDNLSLHVILPENIIEVKEDHGLGNIMWVLVNKKDYVVKIHVRTWEIIYNKDLV